MCVVICAQREPFGLRWRFLRTSITSVRPSTVFHASALFSTGSMLSESSFFQPLQWPSLWMYALTCVSFSRLNVHTRKGTSVVVFSAQSQSATVGSPGHPGVPSAAGNHCGSTPARSSGGAPFVSALHQLRMSPTMPRRLPPPPAPASPPLPTLTPRRPATADAARRSTAPVLTRTACREPMPSKVGGSPGAGDVARRSAVSTIASSSRRGHVMRQKREPTRQ